MAKLCVCWSSMVPFPAPPPDHDSKHHLLNIISTSCGLDEQGVGGKRSVTVSAAKSGGFASVSH